jgi:hypothetical protein
MKDNCGWKEGCGCLSLFQSKYCARDTGNPDVCSENCKKISREKMEELSDFIHDMWTRWMTVLFQRCTKKTEDGEVMSLINDDGTVTIPKWAVDRWMRQMYTDYENLPECEKDTDRIEAKRIMKIMNFREW